MTIGELYKLKKGDKIRLSRSMILNSTLYLSGSIALVHSFEREPLRVFLSMSDGATVSFVISGGGFSNFERVKEDAY